jgi:F-type H+-transporting ATPase subunit delta
MSRVANRYSKALFQLARERQKIDGVQADFNSLQELMRTSVDFRQLLHNPLITAAQKVDIISRTFQGKSDDLTLHFLVLVCRKKRSQLLEEIISDFHDRVLENKGILKGSLVSAHHLVPDQLDQIRKHLEEATGKTIILEEHLDQNLVGGFVVKIKDTVLDLSVKGQLERLRAKLIYG